MGKKALSVTLDEANVVWLKGRVAAGGASNLSELLDGIVSEARAAGRGAEVGMRSVAGTIDIAGADPELLDADVWVRSQFETSIRRPMLVKETAPKGRRRG